VVSRRGGVARRLLAIWNSRGDRGLCCSCQDLFKSACAHRRSALVRWQRTGGWQECGRWEAKAAADRHL
jgi:hypothetical protein